MEYYFPAVLNQLFVDKISLTHHINRKLRKAMNSRFFELRKEGVLVNFKKRNKPKKGSKTPYGRKIYKYSAEIRVKHKDLRSCVHLSIEPLRQWA